MNKKACSTVEFKARRSAQMGVRMNNELRLEQVMRDVFEEEDFVLDATLMRDDIEEWDSMVHIQLVLALEKEFNLKFTTKQIVEMKSIGDIINIINESLK